MLVAVASYKPAVVYGGPIYCISALCEELESNDISVTVLTTNANAQNDFAFKNLTARVINGVNVIYCRRIVGDPVSISPAHTWALLKCIQEYDMIHIHGWWNWVSIVSLIVCKIYRKPHVLSPHGALSEYTFKTKYTGHIKKWLHILFFKRMLSRTLLHVTSEEESSKFRGVLPKAQVVNIPNILSHPAYRHMHIDDHKPIKLIFLGRIDPVKNLELLISALHEVSFPYHLDIVGDGDPKYINLLQRLIEDNVQISMAGPVYGELKYVLLAKADLLVLLSHTENFGNVVLEALSQGTAVLVSDTVGAAEIVSAHDLGWVVYPEKQICIDALNGINQNRQRLKEIRETAPEVLEKHFSPSVLLSRYINDCYGKVNPKFKRITQMTKSV